MKIKMNKGDSHLRSDCHLWIFPLLAVLVFLSLGWLSVNQVSAQDETPTPQTATPTLQNKVPSLPSASLHYF